MTAAAASAASPAFPATAGGWPAPEPPFLAPRPLRPGNAPSPVRFGDEVWPLNAAHPDAHAATFNILWSWFPATLVLPFKAFALAALTDPWAQDPAAFLTRVGDQPSIATIVNWMKDLRLLAAWMQIRQIPSLPDITSADLDAYRDHVLSLDRSTGRKAAMLTVVRTLWAYRACLPAACQITCDPFGGATGAAITGSRHLRTENKTPRIAPATMDALLAWALRMVEEFGPDIAAACAEHQQLADLAHPCQAKLSRLNHPQRITEFIRQARLDGTALPGNPGSDPPAVNYAHLGKILGVTGGGWPPHLKMIVAESGLPIAPASYLAAITPPPGRQPWRSSPITITELAGLRRMLSAAAFIIICYLSGMRPGEVLNLRRGCAATDQATGELLVLGRHGKGHDRHPASGDDEPSRPWVVVQPVHAAITMLESVTPGPLLFPPSQARPGAGHGPRERARTATLINSDIAMFITWVNTAFTGPAGTLPIPADPIARIHSTRFRRTLAYFIVRRPRGLIAAALQYGHVHTKVTLGYSGCADTSWMDDLTIERLEMILDQASQDSANLHLDEHVSGPSAAEYKRRVTRTAPYAGRTVTTARGAERLLAQTGPAVHHGTAMTCVWRPETAACTQARQQQGLPAGDGPDDSACRTTCVNLAYTDRDIFQQQQRLAALQHAAADPLAPLPRRDRAAAQAIQIQAIINRHEQTRPPRSKDNQ
jgi:integrase